MSGVERLFAMRLQRDGAAAFVQCAARGNDIVRIEGREIKPLAENEDVAGEIAGAAGNRLIVTAGA